VSSNRPEVPIGSNAVDRITMPAVARVLVVFEGINDIEFLRRISRILCDAGCEVPDLSGMERWGALIFVPMGGGSLSAWTNRLQPLRIPEFHLYDRELLPETDSRQAAVDQINVRRGCRAELTTKRSLENYLHPQAVCEAGQIEIDFGDFDNVPELVAQNFYEANPSIDIPWSSLLRRAKRRLAERAKRWLNMRAIERMTPELLAARDPQGEVDSWLRTIGALADAGS
jgi:putative ATP-dependent endonuclease of OLD family